MKKISINGFGRINVEDKGKDFYILNLPDGGVISFQTRPRGFEYDVISYSKDAEKLLTHDRFQDAVESALKYVWDASLNSYVKKEMHFRSYESPFASFLQEQNTPADVYASSVEAAIRKSFPKSFVNVRSKPTSFTGKKMIDVFFRVGAGKQNWINGIDHNDIAMVNATIWGIDDATNTMQPKIQFDPSMGGSITIKPPADSHMAFGDLKVGLRKKMGTPDQVLRHIENYFTKLRSMIDSNTALIPDDRLVLLKGII